MKKPVLLILLFISISTSLFSQQDYVVLRDTTKIERKIILFFENLKGKDFPASELLTIENEVLSPDSLRGKVLFVNFWFQECSTCMKEMKGLQKLYERYKSDSTMFLMITFESPETIKKVRDKYNLKYKMISTDRKVLEGWKITQGYPTSLIIDKKGKIYYGKSGISIVFPAKNKLSKDEEEEKASKYILDTYGPIIESALSCK